MFCTQRGQKREWDPLGLELHVDGYWQHGCWESNLSPLTAELSPPSLYICIILNSYYQHLSSLHFNDTWYWEDIFITLTYPPPPCVFICHNMWSSEDSSWEAVLFLWVKDLDSSLSDFVAGAFNGCLALGVNLSFPVRYLQVVYRDFSAHLGSSVNLFSYILVSVTASCCFLSWNPTILRPLLHGTAQHQLLWPPLSVLQDFLLLYYCS